MTYDVTNDLPIPKLYKTYPFLGMKIGDHFFVSGEKNMRRVRSAASAVKKRMDMRFTCRLKRNEYGEVVGINVWRIS